MSLTLADVINDIIRYSFWTSFIPIIIGILRFTNLSRGAKCIFLLALVSVLSDILIKQYIMVEGVPSMVGRIFTVSEFVLTSIFFFYEFNRKGERILILVVGVLFLLVAAIDYLLQGVGKMDNLSMAIEAMVLVAYSVWLLFTTIRDTKYPNILDTTQFWFIAGILIYFGGSIFIFISSNYFSKEMITKMWSIHNLFTIVYNVLISIGLWKARKQYQ
jgi:hypothetical protein